MKHEVFPVKVSVNVKYKKIIDFYTKDYSLSKLINVLLSEVERDKSFKFKVLKQISKL